MSRFRFLSLAAVVLFFSLSSFPQEDKAAENSERLQKIAGEILIDARNSIVSCPYGWEAWLSIVLSIKIFHLFV